MIDPITGLPMASGPNTSRPMHTGQDPRNSQFENFMGKDLGHQGLNPAVPADQLRDLDNPYSRTT